MIRYCLGCQEYLVLTDTVITRFRKYRQTGRRPEAGGQLFGTFESARVRIECATGPRRTDQRRRNSFVPDRRAERREIKHLYEEGLHYVGDWHTHPRRRPTPSGVDVENFGDTFRRSRHDLPSFILIIVGLDSELDDLYVGLCNGERMTPLRYGGVIAEDKKRPRYPIRRKLSGASKIP